MSLGTKTRSNNILVTGEFLTRLTIQAAMCAWTLGIVSKGRVSKWAWSTAIVIYLVHIFFAFEVHYGWSQKVALEETARQTYQLTGWNNGIGLWVNYAFTAFLACDLWNQWSGHPERLRNTRNGIVLFMILNGAVIFGTGLSRQLGIVLLGVVTLVWLRRTKSKIRNKK